MKTFLLITASALCLVRLSSAAVMVTTTADGSVLADNIAGTGVSISNVSYTGAPTASGIFDDGGSAGIGIESGILLTTGDAQTAAGPNTAPDASGLNGTPGDPDLEAIIGGTTFDAVVLSFDFTTDSGDLFFNFVFASEEYSEFVDSQFNDVFALFVNGVNVALAPDGQEVAINTVNCGNPFSGLGPNCASFNNNEDGDFDIEYDGFTDVFTAEVLGLPAGTHSFKAVLADVSDSQYDSAIFIEAGTFSGEPTSEVPEPSTLVLFGAGLIIALSNKARRFR